MQANLEMQSAFTKAMEANIDLHRAVMEAQSNNKRMREDIDEVIHALNSASRRKNIKSKSPCSCLNKQPITYYLPFNKTEPDFQCGYHLVSRVIKKISPRHIEGTSDLCWWWSVTRLGRCRHKICGYAVLPW